MPLLWWPFKRELLLFTRGFLFATNGLTWEQSFWFVVFMLKLTFLDIGGSPSLPFNKLTLECWLTLELGRGFITNNELWFLLFSVYWSLLFFTNDKPLFLFDLSRDTLMLISFWNPFYYRSKHFTAELLCSLREISDFVWFIV